MLTPLRQEMTDLLNSIPTQRKPALRRSNDPDWLLTTDVPSLCSAQELELFMIKLRARSWKAEVINGWLYLDHPISVTRSDFKTMSGESACVEQILLRHPSGQADCKIIRQLAKISEEGLPKLEAFSREWHQVLAAQLRNHEPLPDLTLPYLRSAYSIIVEKEKEP